MHVEPTRLEGQTVTLVPLAEEHAPELQRAGDAKIFQFIGVAPTEQTPDGYRAYILRLLQTPAMCPFAVIERTHGQAIGVTTYMEIRPEHRGLEIGSTWIGRAYHATKVNPECKFLLLRHAFEQLQAIRVQLKTDLRNTQSQAAIAKLGALREGVLRKQIVMPDGYLRDTVMFSIIAEEWLGVKRRLLERLELV